ncbi:MAG: hypothetical protein ABI456_14415 [Ktedonobacteraceae bacterium]
MDQVHSQGQRVRGWQMNASGAHSTCLMLACLLALLLFLLLSTLCPPTYAHASTKDLPTATYRTMQPGQIQASMGRRTPRDFCLPVDFPCQLKQALGTAASWAATQTFQQIKPLVDWINSNPAAILTRTNEQDTYLNPTVHTFLTLSDGVALTALTSILCVAGYNVMRSGQRSSETIAALPEIGIAMILSFFAIDFMSIFIQISNDLCGAIGQVATIAGFTNIFKTLFTVDIVTAGIVTFVLAALISATEILLGVEMLMRIVLLDVFIAGSPIGILCFTLPQLRPIGILYLKGFFVVLFVQPIQILILGMAGALMSSVGSITTPLPQAIMEFLLGIAACYLAIRVPFALGGWALRPALDATQATMHAVGETAQKVATTAARIITLP